MMEYNHAFRYQGGHDDDSAICCQLHNDTIKRLRQTMGAEDSWQRNLTFAGQQYGTNLPYPIYIYYKTDIETWRSR